jgi:hypothetical protein
MSKKFNGHRCERRNLTDLVLGTGPTGKKRAKPKAKKRSKNFATEPAVNQRYLGGPYTDYNAMFAPQQPMAVPNMMSSIMPPSSIPSMQLQQQQLQPGMTQQQMQQYLPKAPLMDRVFGEQVDMSNLAPGEVADAMNANQVRQGKVALGSAALSTAGQFIQNSDLAQGETTGGDVATGVGGAMSGLGMALPYAAMIPGVAPFAVVGGAIASVYKKKAAEQKANLAMRERLGEENKMRLEATKDYTKQVQEMYDPQGQVVNGYMAKYGGAMGQSDYETEGGEVMMASPSDPPVGLANGGYNKMSKNMYKAVGPKHERGGIPTSGATEGFVDAQGQSHDSPYVFSDAKEMRFDASQILSMIR